MKTYKLNNQKIITNLDRNKIYAVSRPIISYPFTFTGSVRNITQEFVVGSTNVPPFDPTLTHPLYNQAYIVSQSEANADPMGFARFTRTYIEFTGDEIIYPTTMSFTFPTLWIGINYEKRGGTPEVGEGEDPIPDPVGLRRNPLTLTIPVEEKLELIYVGDGVEDTETDPTDIPLGSSIQANGYSWNLTANNNGVGTLERTNEEGEIIIQSFNLTAQNYTLVSANPDFTKISPTLKYNIKDVITTWGDGVLINNDRNPHASEVDFVDNGTSPNLSSYLQLTNKKTKVCLETSSFEHLGGFVYIKKTKFGYLR
nr:hypothetical protein [uncultured Mediterranean phage uvMED]